MPTRALTGEASQQLQDELGVIFPGSETGALAPGDVDPLFDRLSKIRFGRRRAAWDTTSGRMIGFIFDGQARPSRGVWVRPLREPDDYDQHVAQGYVRVFNSDLALAPDVLRHRELWDTLTADRFPRAIARASAFHTSEYREALAAVDAASQLTYEGAAFNACVFMTKQVPLRQK